MTLSVVLGDTCNADCEFCISKLTFKADRKYCPIWFKKLRKACMVAQMGGADTAIITSKHEPTMAGDPRLFNAINVCSEYFPIIELQTNGMKLADADYRDKLMEAGLTTLAISGVSYRQDVNQKVISKNYPDLSELVPRYKDEGFLTRFCSIMIKETHGHDVKLLEREIEEIKNLGFHQLTLRIMGAPEKNLMQENKKADEVFEWVEENRLDFVEISEIKGYLESNFELMRKYPWGSLVYSGNGMSICIADCLSDVIDEHNYRYVIYYPDGHLRYRWDMPEALIF